MKSQSAFGKPTADKYENPRTKKNQDQDPKKTKKTKSRKTNPPAASLRRTSPDPKENQFSAEVEDVGGKIQLVR